MPARTLLELESLTSLILILYDSPQAAACPPGEHLELIEAIEAGDGELETLLVRQANELVERDFAETVILTGAVMAGVAARIQSRVAVPVLDGIAAGVPQAELLARACWPKPTRGSYAAPGKRELVNVDAAVAKRFT